MLKIISGEMRKCAKVIKYQKVNHIRQVRRWMKVKKQGLQLWE